MKISSIPYVFFIVMLHTNIAYGNNEDINAPTINPEKTSFEYQMNERKKEMEDFNLAMKMDTITAMQDFLSLYPTSPFVEMATSTIERLQYKEAENKNTIEAFNYYLNEHTESKYAEKAIYKRSTLINTINGYDSYLTKYPNGDWKKSILYKKAKLIDTVEAYNEILLNVWPNNDSVIYYRDKAALKFAKEIGTKDAFGSFIEDYPNSSWIDQAKYFYKYGYDPD